MAWPTPPLLATTCAGTSSAQWREAQAHSGRRTGTMGVETTMEGDGGKRERSQAGSGEVPTGKVPGGSEYNMAER